MYKYEKTQKNLLFAVCVILLILHPLIIHSQEIDEKIATLFLSESDMPGYEILRTGKSKWWSYNTDYISQTWIMNGTEERDGFIDIAVWEFDSMWDAVYDMEISIGPKTHEFIFIWGSPIGSIRADESWYLVGAPSFEISFFSRGNVVIGIYKHTDRLPPDDITIEYLVSKMLAKVEQNLDPAILAQEQNARAKQISSERFGQFTDATVQSDIMSGYSKSTEWDAKWLVDENTFTMGRRTEWKTDSGAVIGVDICEFDSDANAQKAVEFHTQPFGVTNKTRFFDINDPSSLDSIIAEWPDLFTTSNIFCVKGNTAMQVYHYDPGGFNRDNLKAIVSELGASLSF